MKSLESAILKIKENPNKYLGNKSLKALNIFMCGYVLSERSEGGEYVDRFATFQEFIQQKYKVTWSKNYSEIICFFSSSDGAAFDEFYVLLEEFQKNGGVI